MSARRQLEMVTKEFDQMKAAQAKIEEAMQVLDSDTMSGSKVFYSLWSISDMIDGMKEGFMATIDGLREEIEEDM